MKKTALLVLTIGTQAIGLCQTTISEGYELTGSFVTTSNGPAADAIVQLLKSSDSSLVKTEFTDERGVFAFSHVVDGNYLIQANVLGFTQFISAPFPVNSSKTLPDFQLQKSEVTLNEVTVTTRKAYIEREHGKMIVNVENSIASTGSSAFEVIEKAPGVRVDNNDNISFKGKQGVSV